jgi:hypothetical protein
MKPPQDTFAAKSALDCVEVDALGILLPTDIELDYIEKGYSFTNPSLPDFDMRQHAFRQRRTIKGNQA